MNDNSKVDLPQILDEDIAWASRLLDLSDDAFYGSNGSDPRQKVLKSMETIDVAACPGSGKTTLLVAKLAMLAEKWRYHTRGICVLSHTNVARREIEIYLGNTTAGRRLLSYPHFIGTIHSFVIDFLSVPWLTSIGYPIKIIDTEICLQRRWKALKLTTKQGLEKNHHDRKILSIKSTSFSVGDVTWGKGRLGENTDTYRDIQRACQSSASQGYFCYDEMFIWAKDLLEKELSIDKVIRNRFPLLFIDEAQDNSDHQSAILKRIFLDGDSPVIRQRFGDGNQAIFDSTLVEEATTDEFPTEGVKRSLPDSHRFGQKIANLADPLGILPYRLKGEGPKKRLASGMLDARHTIFLFDEINVGLVLDAYGKLLIQTFSEQELRDGTFSAVGHIHSDKGDTNKPRHVGHYWPLYDPQLTTHDSNPDTFVQYVFAGLERANATGETHMAIEKIASGILRLSRMANAPETLTHRRHHHRYVFELLAESPDVRRLYQDLIARTVVTREILTKEIWETHWRNVVQQIADTIAGSSSSGAEAESFLSWTEKLQDIPSSLETTKSRDNLYPYPADDPKVHIRVGSIHSVKGETHTATLLLETFWYAHNLELLSPWLDGRKSGGQSETERQKYRLKLHYVAMTRPTHLLCLAMKQSTFADNEGALDRDNLLALRSRGWDVQQI
jgi:DNA helicase-2/ATP-dependent DNA helicase PcrA